MSQIIDQKLVILNENDRVIDGAAAMVKYHVWCVVTADDLGRISGVITDRDVAAVMVSPLWNPDTLLSQIVKRNIVSLEPSCTLSDILALTKEHEARRLLSIQHLSDGDIKVLGFSKLEDLISGEFVSEKNLVEALKNTYQHDRKVVWRHSRSESRAEQTYHKFLTHISHKLEMDKNSSEKIFRYLIECLVRRIPYAGSIQFLSQLPRFIQEEMVKIPVSSDRTINAQLLIEGVASFTGKDDEAARLIIRQFWKALCELIGHGETDQVIMQLPKPMKELFVGNVWRESAILEMRQKEYEERVAFVQSMIPPSA